MAEQITEAFAASLLKEKYGIAGTLERLPGELDHNFKVKSEQGKFILKISGKETDPGEIEFQKEILSYMAQKAPEVQAPRLIASLSGKVVEEIEMSGTRTFVRLISWMEGMLWAHFTPHDSFLLESLGKEAGRLTQALQGFESPFAHRIFDWDISNAGWTEAYQERFRGEEKELIQYFYSGFNKILPLLQRCRKSVVHNDSNDYNILVKPGNPAQVAAIIDYGDAVYTATINDLAVAITYSVMGLPDPLEAATQVLHGYHQSFPIEEQEVELLYWLVGARLVISLTKSSINREKEPENTYLLISEKPAWALLRQWREIGPDPAAAFFRKTIGCSSHPETGAVTQFLTSRRLSVENLIKAENPSFEDLDLDISSPVILEMGTFQKADKFRKKLKSLWVQKEEAVLCGGYGEVRLERNLFENAQLSSVGTLYKNRLLGTQFWSFTPFEVVAPLPGIVVQKDENALVLSHQTEGRVFYTIYQNLQPIVALNEKVEAGQKLGDFTGASQAFETFFFQVSLIPEPKPACTWEDFKVYKDLYLDPAFLFKDLKVEKHGEAKQEIIDFRKSHLGKSLSISYKEPLKIVRGDGIYLIDQSGRRYLDMVNNVAHVGHEHPDVVRAGQKQMALLNTNSRYLHDNIVELAENLLSTFPPELSVVTFVNSGSEANELAIRMAKACTGQKDFIAVEIGYHGNSNACIDISSYKFDGKGGSGAPEHTHIIPLPDTFRGKHTGPDAAHQYASYTRDQVEIIQKKGRGVAAFICESIVSCGGQIELPEGYLQEVYDIVRQAGGLCIADEVQIGCGRVGKTFWGFQLHGVSPDIVTLGKPIGNGHPLAAVVCTQKVADAFANGMEYFNTFGGNPVSCAIGNEVLNVIRREHLRENAEEMGEYVKAQLRDLQKEFPIIADVRGQGLFIGFELLTADRKPADRQAAYLADRMKELGVLMSPDGPDHNVMKLKPPMVFNRENADTFLRVLKEILQEKYMEI